MCLLPREKYFAEASSNCCWNPSISLQGIGVSIPATLRRRVNVAFGLPGVGGNPGAVKKEEDEKGKGN